MAKQEPATELASVLEKMRRWRTRAKRAATALAKLERRRLKLETAIISPTKAPRAPKPTASTALNDTALGQVVKVKVPPSDDLDIPDYLRRKREGDAKDAAARAEIEAEAQARKTNKTKRRIEKMKAKQSGTTKAVPLSGRAALDYINQ